jgi:hypothetical protein
MKFQTALRNAVLDVIESTIGTAPVLFIFTGSAPTATTDADSGTKLLEATLPSDWLANASAGAKAKAGTWSGTGAASGTPGHFRIKDSGGTVRIQGTAAVGSGELSLDATISLGGTVTISTFTLTEGNA